MKKLLLSFGVLLFISPVSSAFANDEINEIESEAIKTDINEDVVRDELTSVIPIESEVSTNVLIATDPKYAFSVAWAAGVKIVQKKGHTFTAALMARAYSGPNTLATYGVTSRPGILISDDASFKQILRNYKADMIINSRNSYTYYGGSRFPSGELLTSLEHYRYTITIIKNTMTGKWSYYGYIEDTYDFESKDWVNYYDNLQLTLGNNTGAYGLKMGYRY